MSFILLLTNQKLARKFNDDLTILANQSEMYTEAFMESYRIQPTNHRLALELAIAYKTVTWTLRRK